MQYFVCDFRCLTVGALRFNRNHVTLLGVQIDDPASALLVQIEPTHLCLQRFELIGDPELGRIDQLTRRSTFGQWFHLNLDRFPTDRTLRLIGFGFLLLPHGHFGQLFVVISLRSIQMARQAVTVQIVIAHGFGEGIPLLEPVQTYDALPRRKVTLRQVLPNDIDQIENHRLTHGFVQFLTHCRFDIVDDVIIETTWIF